MRKLNILIVEDESVIAEELRVYLEHAGHTVTAVVAGARAAVTAVACAEPDLILMDIRLKGEEDGIDAATVIGERSNVPIVFMTAYSDTSTIERAMLTRPFGYVVKPIRAADLIVAVQTATLRHDAEERLRANDDQFRDLVEGTTDLIVQFLVDGRLLEANPVCREVLGYSAGQICRLRFRDLVAESEWEALTAVLSRSGAEPGTCAFALTLRTRTGSDIPAKAVVGKRLVGGQIDRLWAVLQPLGAREKSEYSVKV